MDEPGKPGLLNDSSFFLGRAILPRLPPAPEATKFTMHQLFSAKLANSFNHALQRHVRSSGSRGGGILAGKSTESQP